MSAAPNYFVQFDSPTAASPNAAPPSTGNYFDQFDAPKQTALGAAQAGASGINAGVADVAGLPVDTVSNVLELGKAGLGFVYHEATGNPIPETLEPTDPANYVGSSAWIKAKARSLAGSGVVDAAQPTTLNRYIRAGAEAVPGAVTGDEGGTVGAAKAATAGATAGLAQEAAGDVGASAGTQAAIGVLAGAAAGRATQPKVITAGAPAASAPEIAPTKFEPAAPLSAAGAARGTAYTDLEGAPPSMNIGGHSTAADTARVTGVPVPEVAKAPTAEAGEPLPVTTTPEQATREQTLRDIGLSEARDSAITGDTKATGTDFQTSKLDNEPGNRMSSVINNERSALQGYAGQIADATGGTRGLDSPALYQRGEAIAKPIEELSDYYDGKIKDAYKAADQAAGGVPIDMQATRDFLKNERSQFLATVEGKQLREGLQARMRDLGLMDEDGNVQQASVQQAERLKQFMSDAWSPRTSRLIGQLKGAIDDDVTKAAGSDIYQSARQTRAQRATLLDDPTGIAKLAEPEDRLGINRTVPLEQIPDYVANLPVDQFGHVVKTLRDVPPEVQPSAASALNEIRSHFANRVEAAGNSTQGMWNTKGVNEYLNKNQMKMAEVFSPEELGRFKTLADAGNILKMDRTYPGAAAQQHNLAMRGVLQAGKVAGKLGGAIGLAATHGVEGGATGHVISGLIEKGTAKIGDKALSAAVEKRIRKLQ